MTDPADVFFRGHLAARRRGLTRDLGLFGVLLSQLGVADLVTTTPVLAVVGSKGKGTTAAAATFEMVQAGRTVVTVTSPHYVSLRERIRIDGRPLDDTEFESVSSALEHALGHVPLESDTGYLSPVGRFLAMGVWFAQHVGADTMVVEAGMGGRSDEVSGCSPDVLAVSEIFEEHLGVLGDDLREIAVEKLAVATVPGVRQVVSLQQSSIVTEVAHELQRSQTEDGPTWTTVDLPGSGQAGEAAEDAHTIRLRNTLLGVRAARTLLGDASGATDRNRLEHAVRAVHLPGRLQRVELGHTSVVVDSAATPAGVAAALRQLGATGWTPELIICGIPADRDPKAVDAAIHRVSGQIPSVFCSFRSDKFAFSESAITLDAALVRARELPRVLVTGVVSFVGMFLAEIGADPQPWWAPGEVPRRFILP